MCEAFAELTQKFSEFSLSKFSSILKQPTMDLLMSSLKCDCNALEDIIELFFQIDKMKDFSQIEEFTKIEKLNSKKSKFYQILCDVVVAKTKKYINSIIPLIKQKLTQILEIYKANNQEKEQKQEMSKRLLEVQKKLDQLVLMAMTKIKSACQKVQQLVIGTQKLKKWNCDCNKLRCKNRYEKGYIWKYIFKNIILPNELLKVYKIQDVQNCSIHNNFQKLMHVGQESTEEKKALSDQLEDSDYPFCKNGDFSIFMEQKQKKQDSCLSDQKICKQQKQDSNQKLKQKKKKKKKKKGGLKNKINESDKDLDELQTNQSTGAKGQTLQKLLFQQKIDLQFESILKNIKQLQIKEDKRIECNINDTYLLKWAKRNKGAIQQQSKKQGKWNIKQLKKSSNFDYMQQ